MSTQREIKFRAWVETYNGKEMIDNWCFLDVKNNHFMATDLTNERPDVGEVYSIMQYTGLKDKNENGIYEGDILTMVSYNYQHHNVYKYEVYYCQESLRFKLRNNVPYPHNVVTDVTGYHSFEVIGNIYENPDLLKK